MRGKLWWIADNDTELNEWQDAYFSSPDIKVLKTARIPKENGRVQVVFELNRVDAPRLLGYTPNNLEWLED